MRINRLKNIVILWVVFLPQILLAQHEADHWIFGEHAAISFSTGTAVNISSPIYAINTIEGCMSMSDSQGKLLFYVGADSPYAGYLKIWIPYDDNSDGLHDIMPGGHNIFGDVSATQAAIAIPYPKHTNQYFLLTLDKIDYDENLGSYVHEGIRYSIIDMNDNNGKGSVISSNNMVIPHASEKISVIKGDGDFYWIITYANINPNNSLLNNAIIAFKLDENGLSNINSQSTIINSISLSTYDGRGYLKFSSDGSQVAIANTGTKQLAIFNFNNSTGKITLKRNLSTSLYVDEFPYGIEFSPSGELLYVTTYNDVDVNTPGTAKLIQYDIINNYTKTTIHSYTGSRGALQLAIDGKIYRALSNSYNGYNAGSSYLGVIENPDNSGSACNYTHHAIYLGSGKSRQGLPPFIQSFFTTQIIADDGCLGVPTDISLSNTDDILSFVWDFGDNTPQDSTNIAPVHTYLNPGTYTIQITVTTSTEVKTFSKDVEIFELPELNSGVVLQQCDDDNDGYSLFNLNEVQDMISSNAADETFTYYESEKDAEDKNNEIPNPTTYQNTDNINPTSVWTRVENSNGCFSIVEFTLDVSETKIPDTFFRTIETCDDYADGEPYNGISTFNLNSIYNEVSALFPNPQDIIITIYRTLEDGLAEHNAITDLSNYRNEGFPNSQLLTIRVDSKSNNACLGLGEHALLIVNPNPEVPVLAEHAIVCLGEDPLVLEPVNIDNSLSYEWQDAQGSTISTTSSIEVTSGGIYHLFVTNDATGCTSSSSITVDESQQSLLTTEDLMITQFSYPNSITIPTGDAFGLGDYEYSLDPEGPFNSEVTISDLTGGEYILYVRDLNGCLPHEVPFNILDYMRFFTPNGDGHNDYWNLLGKDLAPTAELLIYDRYGKLVANVDPQSDGWDGTYNGHPLPSTDYWFVIILEDGTVKKGNFSLIRR